MSPPGYSNGHADPVGAEHQALIAAVARGVARLENAERAFNLAAKTLVADQKAIKMDLGSVKDEVTDIKAVLLRVEAGQERLEAKLGTYPMSEDLVKAMERESVRELSPEAIAERDARLSAAKYGTGLIGEIKRTQSRLESKDQELSSKDEDLEKRLSEMSKKDAADAAQAVLGDAQKVAKTERYLTVVKAVGAGFLALIVGIVTTVATNAEGLVKVVHAVQGRDVVPAAPAKPETPEAPR